MEIPLLLQVTVPELDQSPSEETSPFATYICTYMCVYMCICKVLFLLQYCFIFLPNIRGNTMNSLLSFLNKIWYQCCRKELFLSLNPSTIFPGVLDDFLTSMLPKT